MKLKFFSILVCLFGILAFKMQQQPKEMRILVFSKTNGFRHKSIPAGISMFEKIGREQHIKVDTTEDARIFNDKALGKYNAIVFLSTTGDLLNHAQQTSLQRYIQAGGGFMGVHGASGAEYNWPWYGKLVGARFESHPPELQKGLVSLTERDHLATKGLPATWEPIEEWYNFTELSSSIRVLGSVSEGSYQGGKHGDNHPIFWCQEFDGGKSFYTALGHTPETYSDPVFIRHIIGGLKFITEKNHLPDYGKSSSLAVPDSNGFTQRILSGNEHIQEPMELAVAKNGMVFIAERRGNLRLYNPVNQKTKIIGTIPVYTEHEDGLLGLALDPNFSTNYWLYVFYSAPGSETNYHLSRLSFDPKTEHVSVDSEKVLLKIHEEHTYSNHTGGSIAFDKDGNLFVSVGDNTIPFASKGYAPTDEGVDRVGFDAQRSSGNTNDLRGKILRIHPQPDGTYTIPEGNLFKGEDEGRPEIYVMGNRNPFRISVDPKTSWLYWGEVGPDASKDGAEGPKGYDEINQARAPGNFGWPYFVADNKPYAKVDFSTGAVGSFYDPKRPANQAPRNTGAKILPPAQKPLIWYPYSLSSEFPLLGAGGRTAMAGPVYHYDKTLKSEVKLPEYYDKGLFIYDWIRKWIMVVRLDEHGNYQSMEPFMESTSFAAMIDMELGPDGALYTLEYGLTWYQPNTDARLSRIEFSEKPINSSNDIKKTPALGSQKNVNPATDKSLATVGSLLISKSNCKACHAIDQNSVGPSFKEIAKRYKGEPAEVERLAGKIINGGGGVWGPHVMSAHPQLTKKQSVEMVKYILLLK